MDRTKLKSRNNKMKIKFLNPNERIYGKERRSKLLDPQSELYKWADTKYKELVMQYGLKVGSKRMDYHIELIGRDENEELLVSRAQELEGMEIEITRLKRMGRAYVLEVDRKHHVTIAFFPKGVPRELR